MNTTLVSFEGGAALPIAAKNLALDVSLSRDASGPQLEAELRAEALFSSTAPSAPDFELRGLLHRDGAALVLSQLSGTTAEGEVPLEASGRVDRLFAPGTWRLADWGESTIDVRARADLPELEELVPTGKELRRIGGELGVQAHLTGPLRAPAWEGFVTLERGEVRWARSGVSSAQALSGRCRLEGDTLYIEQLSGELGAAPFALDGEIRSLLGSNPHLSVGLRGDSLLLYRARGIKVRADADLRCEGPLDALRIHGSVGISDGRYTRNADLYSFLEPGGSAPVTEDRWAGWAIEEGPLANAVFDVEIQNVEAFAVGNNLVTGSLRPELHLGGSGRIPELTGSVYVDRSTLSLPASSLNIESGVLRWGTDDPLVPQLDLIAEQRLLGFDVQAVITGTAAEPVITLNSQPPLGQEDLLLLVLAGKPPEEVFGRRTGEQALQSVATYLGRDVLRRFMGDESTEGGSSLLDRLEIETGRDRTSDGVETIEARFLLRDAFPGERGALYLDGERTQRNEYQMGFKLVFRFR